MARRGGLIDFNAPVILGLTAAAFVAVMAGTATGGYFSMLLACRFSAWTDPFMYLRLFTHIFAHQDMAHFSSNFVLILAIGPMVEEKYGSGQLASMIVATSLVTGIVNIVFFRGIALIGASGIAFMLILLASFTNLRGGRIPVTFLLVAFIYIGGEIYSGLTVNDNISRISHIIGGVCGAVFGFMLQPARSSPN